MESVGRLKIIWKHSWFEIDMTKEETSVKAPSAPVKVMSSLVLISSGEKRNQKKKLSLNFWSSDNNDLAIIPRPNSYND